MMEQVVDGFQVASALPKLPQNMRVMGKDQLPPVIRRKSLGPDQAVREGLSKAKTATNTKASN